MEREKIMEEKKKGKKKIIIIILLTILLIIALCFVSIPILKQKFIDIEKGKVEEYYNNGKYEKAYNILTKYNMEVEKEAEIKQKYIIQLIKNNKIDEAIGILRNTEELTEDQLTEVMKEYIVATIYPKAYNTLYNSMKNPNSLKVSGYTFSVWFYNGERENSKNKASYVYNKEFCHFSVDITLKYSGTNSFGGVVTNSQKYTYWGQVDTDYKLIDIYKTKY